MSKHQMLDPDTHGFGEHLGEQPKPTYATTEQFLALLGAFHDTMLHLRDLDTYICVAFGDASCLIEECEKVEKAFDRLYALAVSSCSFNSVIEFVVKPALPDFQKTLHQLDREEAAQ